MMTQAKNSTRRFDRIRLTGLVLAIALCLVAGGTSVYAQSKNAAKASEALAKSGDNAKKSIQQAVEQLGKMLEGYNSIIDGSAKNPQSAYKKLTGDMKSTEKMIQGAQKDTESMDKQAQKFFADWEKDLDTFTDDGLKQKSQQRLDASKEKYAALGEALGQAGEAFAPLIENLSQQIMFLGRDLSPEAIADLQGEAEALNQQAEEITEQVKSLMDGGA